MGFAFFILYLTLTFVRPGEQDASLGTWRWMEIASVLALATAVLAVAAGRGPSFRSKQIPLVLALWTWALLTVAISPTRSDIAFDQVIGFGKASGTAFLLVVLNVVTARRLRIVAGVLTFLSLLVVGQAVVAYHLGVGADRLLVGTERTESSGSRWNEEPVESSGEVTSPVAAGEVARIRGFGFLNDPNDLACTLVAIVPLTLALRRQGASLRNTLLVWLPVGLIAYGIYLTRSRGGVLALAVVLALSMRERLGRTLSILAGAGALMALLVGGFLGGRSMSIDQSATGRIEAWSEGLIMLKSSPVWGVGFGMFTEHHDAVAHNVFVHCFAELGLIGYFLWLGLILVTLHDMRSITQEGSEQVGDLQRWARAATVALYGFLTGGFFLSRSYDVALFILLGLGTAVADLARRRGHLPRPRSLVWWSCLVVGAATASIAVFWLYMRLLR